MTIEEKAKLYVLEQLEENGYRNFHGGEWVEDAFTAGYTQAVTDLNAENEKLREVLNLVYDLIVESTEYKVGISQYREWVLKINELLIKPNN